MKLWNLFIYNGFELIDEYWIGIEYYVLNVLYSIKLCWYGMFWLLIIIIQLINVQSSWITRRIISACLIVLELTQCRIQFICKQKLLVSTIKRLDYFVYLTELTVQILEWKFKARIATFKGCLGPSFCQFGSKMAKSSLFSRISLWLVSLKVKQLIM